MCKNTKLNKYFLKGNYENERLQFRTVSSACEYFWQNAVFCWWNKVLSRQPVLHPQIWIFKIWGTQFDHYSEMKTDVEPNKSMDLNIAWESCYLSQINIPIFFFKLGTQIFLYFLVGPNFLLKQVSYFVNKVKFYYASCHLFYYFITF